MSTVQQWPWYHSRNAYVEIMAEVANGRLFPIETVGLTQRAGYEQSIGVGMDKLKNNEKNDLYSFEGMTDITQARNSLITPIPRA